MCCKWTSICGADCGDVRDERVCVQAALEDDLRSHVHIDQPPIAAPGRAGSAAVARAASVGQEGQRRSGGAPSVADASGRDSAGQAPPARKTKAANRPTTGGASGSSKALQENAGPANAEAGRRGSASRLQPKRGARTQSKMLDEPALPPSSSESGSGTCSPVQVSDGGEDDFDPMLTPPLARWQPEAEAELERQTDEVMRSMVAMHVDELEREKRDLGRLLQETQVYR